VGAVEGCKGAQRVVAATRSSVRTTRTRRHHLFLLPRPPAPRYTASSSVAHLSRSEGPLLSFQPFAAIACRPPFDPVCPPPPIFQLRTGDKGVSRQYRIMLKLTPYLSLVLRNLARPHTLLAVLVLPTSFPRLRRTQSCEGHSASKDA
jgi:hypothetical protein